jgi:tRNA (cmo5U34)-methyltransferase
MADIAESFPEGGWAFTPEVAEAFPDHVRASVPFYDQIQRLVAELADWLAPDGALIADLGCATGTTAVAITRRHPGRDLSFDLYDASAAMLEIASASLPAVLADARTWEQDLMAPLQHSGADLTLALFTLQFLPMPARAAVLAAARAASAESGALIIAEKIRPEDSRWAEIAHDVSWDWKAVHSVSDEAILAKARALRGVLVPSTFSALEAMITAGGWEPPEVLFRWHQWVVIGAFASPDALPFAAQITPRRR